MEQPAGRARDCDEPARSAAPADAHEARAPSVVTRTLVGALCVAVVAGILCLESLGPEACLPRAAEGLTGLKELVEAGLLLGLVTAAVAALALNEYWGFVRRLGADMPRALLVGGGAALLLLQWAGWAYQGGPFAVCPAWLRQPGLTAAVGVCAASFLLLGERVLRGRVEGTFLGVGALALGLVYIAVTLGFLGAIRARWGVAGAVMFLAVCKATDMGAYYAGRIIGGPRLAPRVSPKKTWAGAVGGTLLAALAAAALCGAGLLPWLRMPQAVLFGLLIGAVAIVGDLAESVLKREAGVKDSGDLLPGAGGVLDMVDDVLFTAPVAYFFFLVVYAQ